jgi:hypothetical protein
MSTSASALFVSHASSLEPAGGGVQRCTREYTAALQAAGFRLHQQPYVEDRKFVLRLARRLRPRPYHLQLPAGFAETCASEAARLGARWIFLNHGDTAPLGKAIRQLAPGRFQFALLSHGLDSTDYLHETRILRASDRPRDQRWLGRQLFAEMRQRADLDAVLCLSPTDQAIEQWLGAKRVLMVPRILAESPLAPAPVAGRIGTISTLNHPPNHEGIVLLAEALRRHPGVTLRLVGGPRDYGKALAARFTGLEYLGPLNDLELAREAASWACFVNPIFCYPRGASTKLAVPLGWQIPIATTTAGARGYRWDPGVIPLLDSPEDLAARAASLATLEHFAEDVRATQTIAAATPKLDDLGREIASFLAAIPAPA